MSLLAPRGSPTHPTPPLPWSALVAAYNDREGPHGSLLNINNGEEGWGEYGGGGGGGGSTPLEARLFGYYIIYLYCQ